ncbi:hypothetical protein RB620_23685 [Paenibacillus sp. LHD-117]|uniref:hypothetical protein n=1 Tax=Paenibacillus sp. LHD-117 TaxID=3071412 RepID=UPI0027E15653|nr:hypothetical protein [Paenibacillus sp. LHD-117]MDQ6422437.1 hypothetical protein [Paenibacillus sp. LHD-117]
MILSALAAAYELPSLRKDGRRKEIWAFSLLLLFGAGLATAQSLNVRLPNPMEWVVAIFGPASGWLDAVLS